MIRRFSIIILLLTFQLLLLGVVKSDAATTYLIDFGTVGNQTTTVDANGNRWNNLTGANADATTNPRSGSITLQDIGGTAGIGMNYSFPTTGGDPNFSNKNSTLHASLGSLSNLGLMNIDSATRDVIWSSGPMVFTFTGLDPLLDYSFNLFAYRLFAGRTSSYQLQGLTSSSPTILNVDSTNTGDGTILEFLNYKPNASGEIVLQVNSGTGGYAYLSSVQILVSPEPQRALLLLIGLGTIVLRRRA
ncbi:PEP-CTERM sorting domain-containing protein [Phragmitibacter flavus]|uniref:PEP-CTERM sorting domain-containing protein n=1 Tax=Phragmitibacter flavus TaxID=2576071 RepID=A0A5R8KKH5_9BACT|nr:PEP-CTERM sorting domain-containing protein [Phragmitibacter flavus]TLD72747.1 PEP-CTERM sorting domain-containing protein [Phragmitibacter flavus]